MDFGFSEEQAELAGLTRKILAERDAPWGDLATAGVLAAGLPPALGGAGLGLPEQCSVLIELGRSASSVPYLASVVLGAGALATFGTAAQLQRWAVPAGQGSVVLTAALAEEDGDDPRMPSARAERAGGQWVANRGQDRGRRCARGGPVPGAVRLAGRGAGVRRGAVGRRGAGGAAAADGLRPGGAGRASRVRPVRRPGARGVGAGVADWLVARATVGLCALQSGVIERALELTAEYAKSRVAFGRPIGSFQAVTQRLADAFVDVEAVRLTMWQAAWLLASGAAGSDVAVATAKFWAAEAGHRVAHTAVHVHGGMGIDVTYPVHRYFVAAKRNEFALGGATAQLRRIGGALAG